GGRLRVVSEERASDPEALAEAFEREPVDYLKIVPSHLGALLSASRPERILPRRCLILGGEASSWELIERVRALAPSCEIVNHYGPTEATIGATTYLIPETLRQPRPRTVPIGRPLPNCRVFLLDSRGQTVPLGVAGELCIGGAGVARGYQSRPELTAEKFLVVEVGGTRERLYRTGDLARYLPDGNIELFGRTDDQVKLHGFRIEPGEIEAALRRHPAVQESVVLPRELTGVGKRLVAYFVPRGNEVPASSDLRHFLAEKLPEFMLPSAFVRLKRIPLTVNGKVDRAALSLPDPAVPGGDEPLVAPRTPEEKILSRVWADVLRVGPFSIHDNFFELGGDSILAIQIIARAAREGLRLTPRQLFERQTIAELAEVAEGSLRVEAEQGLVTGPAPLTPIQHWFFEQELLDPQHYNQSILLEAREALDPIALEKAVEGLLVHHDALRLRFARDAAGWRQSNAASENSRVFSVLPLGGLGETEQESAIEEGAAQAQASLKLSQGPMARAILFDLGPQRSARLLLIAHHLSVDGVSWRILVEDLESAYRRIRAGEPAQLPPKTTSFRDWARRLTDLAGSGALEAEAAYWLSRTGGSSAALPLDSEGENTVESARSVLSAFSQEETSALLQEVPSVYRSQINDALLAALVEAFARWTGSPSLLIDLEGHGREEIVSGIDLSRTVGWFTTRFPVLLELTKSARSGESLIAVKEQLRAIPRRGIGYGI
ncbi:MAG TPA: condensation domain-containing protein, partial [Thermoanaerobaculia bacterium]|nr:condensation domain-containing protein [Thermoanaerobaculia bacterium]